MQIQNHPLEILVIGTEPPCPRCDLLGLWVDEIIAAEGLAQRVSVKHLAFNDPQAINFAKEKNKKVGTAKHVAVKAKIHLDKSIVDAWFERRKAEVPNFSRPADLWSEELDRILSECQQAAETVSYLMTPVLVINGEVKHHGCVPAKTEVLNWIREFSSK